jgi:hypothetical protein
MNLYSIDSELLKTLPIQKIKSKKEKNIKVEIKNEDGESNASGETMVAAPAIKRKRSSKSILEPIKEEVEPVDEKVSEPVIELATQKVKKPLTEKQLAAIERRKVINAEKKALKESGKESGKESEKENIDIADQVAEKINPTQEPKKLRRLAPRPPKIKIDQNADLVNGIKELISTLKKDSTVKGDKKEIANEARQASRDPETLGKIKNEISSHRRNMISMIFPNRMV